jgi:hypothetical protein
MRGAIPPLPSTSSLRGSQLSTSCNFALWDVSHPRQLYLYAERENVQIPFLGEYEVPHFQFVWYTGPKVLGNCLYIGIPHPFLAVG